jgi:hypothetical protein
MTEAPKERPAKHTVLREFAGTVAAPPEKVLAALPGTRYGSLVVEQGEWWYRAEYRVTAADRGSRVELTIVNVAQSGHWAAPIAGRDVLRWAERAFTELLRSLE